MKFACDDNLGKLAKYLRLLGFDTYYSEPIADSELLVIAAAQERFLLTRDSHLLGKSHPFGMLLLTDNDPLAQLASVVQSLDLRIQTKNLFTRCSRCNEVCRPTKKNELAERAFPFILRTQGLISECPSCGRLYWKGTHYKGLLAKLKSAISIGHLVGEWPEL